MSRKPKKRAPGGGRKPKGEFSRLTSLFAVRMPDDLRKLLGAAAEESGRSVSQEAIRRLNDSFGVAASNRDPTTRALGFILAELARKIRFPRPDEWHRDPFLFRAFKIGFARVLDALTPQGDEKPPLVFETPLTDSQKAFQEIWKSPEGVADWYAGQTLSDLYSGGWHPDDIRKIWGSVNHPNKDFVKMATKAAERTWYGMSHVRRDLQLTKNAAKTLSSQNGYSDPSAELIYELQTGYTEVTK